MTDNWNAGKPYEAFMGRWSYKMGKTFIDWLSPELNSSWLDIGCGTGALSRAIIDSATPDSILSLDLSEGFVEAAQERLGSSARCLVGDA